MPSDWQRVANTTITKYIRQEEINILRDRALLAKLEAAGRITFNHGGDSFNWKVRYKRAPMRVFTEMDSLTFARVNRWKTAALDWRGYAATDSINKMEKLKNKGPEAIIKVYSQMGENLMDDIREDFSDEFWIDGNAAANAGRLHGVETFLSYSGAADASVGYIGLPNDSYAGLTTTLGTYGGSWSVNGSSVVNWPDGKGDPEYDFWTPLIVDYQDTLWQATTKTWPFTCEEALRYGISKGARMKSLKGKIDLILLPPEMYRLFKQLQATKEQINVMRGEKTSLVSLGFTDVVNLDGCEITGEYGIPATFGYGFNMASTEILSMQESLFVADVPDFDIASQNDRFAIMFFGNAKFNPRHFVAFKPVT